MDSAHIYASARRGLQRINGVTKLTNKAVCKPHTIQRLGLNHVEKEQQSRSDQKGSNAIQNIHFLIASSRKGGIKQKALSTQYHQQLPSSSTYH
jgi:hypothetical protein